MNEPITAPRTQPFGPFIVRHSKVLSILAIGGLLLILFAGSLTHPPQPVANQPTVAKVPTQPVQASTVQPTVTPEPTPIQAGAQTQPPEKSKLEQAQDELKYKSLYGSNVIAEPIASYGGAKRTVEEEGGNTDKTQHTSDTRETNKQGADTAAGSQIKPRNPLDFDSKQPTVTLPEGTVIETVLTNKLEGEMTGPVDCMVTTDAYAPNTRTVVIPKGSRVLGQSTKVGSFGQQRLAVAFHRIIVPGPTLYSIPLDVEPSGSDQQGGVGLGPPYAKVSNHYASIFGASLAIGLIGGLSQIGSYSGSGNGTVIYGLSNGFSQSTAESSALVLNRFLNRLPTATVPMGTRVKIMLAGDLPVPEVPDAK